ncbi:MAG: phosphate ABC transporter permease subunit PstC [Pseudomonadota bacterium]
MTTNVTVFAALCICAVFYLLARGRALAFASRTAGTFQSRATFHGWWVGLVALAPVVVFIAVWAAAGQWIIETLVLQKLALADAPQTALQRQQFFVQIANILDGRAVIPPTPQVLKSAADYNDYLMLSRTAIGALSLFSCFACGLLALRRSNLNTPAQQRVERVMQIALLASSIVAVLTTFAIVLSLVFESLRFFNLVPISDLLGLQWNPQSSLSFTSQEDLGSYGIVPLLSGTLLITFVAMLVAVPIGLMSAIYLTQYAGKTFRAFAKPMLEILAGIPTVVYGFFAALIVAPAVRRAGQSFGLDVASESALAAGLVMGIMIIPFMSSLSDDALAAIPADIKDGSFALGATTAETVRQVLLPAALPGIFGAILLAVSRAIGETMIVVMAAGLAANLTFNPLESVTTVTVQIVKLLTGDQAFSSAKTLSVFALGLILFCMTLTMNAMALFIVRRYRETYE